jgi:CBS domain-containing protein
VNNLSAGNIIRMGRTLSPGDTIAFAAELLKASGFGELPVVSSGRVVGMVRESRVLHALLQNPSDSGSQALMGTVVDEDAVCANPYMTIPQAAEVMAGGDAQVMPVVDQNGAYLGILLRSDVIELMRGCIRPPAIAGMATPLGVHLTTGNIKAGAGNLARVLAGVPLMLMNFSALYLVTMLAKFIQKTTGVPALAAVLGFLLRVLIIVIFLGLFRLLPLSGYHGAEHMVIHAIENGRPLTLESVAEMPRVHPRCGTNIVAGVILFMLVAELFTSDAAIILLVFLLIFAWRQVGWFFQYIITTKDPSEKQLKAGIAAGEELLCAYRENPAKRVGRWQRIWHTGMPQIITGVIIVMALEEVLAGYFPGIL